MLEYFLLFTLLQVLLLRRSLVSWETSLYIYLSHKKKENIITDESSINLSPQKKYLDHSRSEQHTNCYNLLCKTDLWSSVGSDIGVF